MRPRHLLAMLAGLTAAAALLVGAGPASAAQIWNVYCPNDSGYLQNVIDNYAHSGDTIAIHGVCFGNYTIDGSNTNHYGELTLQGASPGAGLNGRGSGSTLQILDYADVTIRNLTITNGNAGEGGGIYADNSELTMTNAVVKSNRADFGGGIWADCSNLTLTGVTVTRNRASYEGGGIGLSDNSQLSATASTVSLNSVTEAGERYGGGGIWTMESNVLLTSTKVTTNTSADYGGGIAGYGGEARIEMARPFQPPVQLVGGLTLVNSSVDHNVAADDGGGIYNSSEAGDAALVLQETRVSFNNARSGDGGGIYNYGVCDWTASLLATGSTLQGNLAPNGDGGAVYNATGGQVCVAEQPSTGAGTALGRAALGRAAPAAGSGTALVTVAQSGVANGPNVVNSNQAQRGAGFANDQDEFGVASLTLQVGARVSGNKASVTGGGVWNNCGSFSSLAQIFLNTPNNVVQTCVQSL